MPNPVTFQLISQIQDPDLQIFVRDWDELEALVITMYREKTVDQNLESRYQILRSRLKSQYPIWQHALENYWQSSRIKGQIIITDPFIRLLSVEHAQDFIGDWEAVQHLPAAREALNNYLLFRIANQKT